MPTSGKLDCSSGWVVRQTKMSTVLKCTCLTLLKPWRGNWQKGHHQISGQRECPLRLKVCLLLTPKWKFSHYLLALIKSLLKRHRTSGQHGVSAFEFTTRWFCIFWLLTYLHFSDLWVNAWAELTLVDVVLHGFVCRKLDFGLYIVLSHFMSVVLYKQAYK